jgi:hypothetical protein
MCEILTKLETWQNGHKSRAVEIFHDDGYGSSSGWQVKLYGKGKEVTVYEIGEGEHPENEVYASNDDWVGLAATIAVVLRKAEELGL